MSYPSVTAEPKEFNGVRVDHPTLLTYIRNAIKKGYNNQQICKIVGLPHEIVEKERVKIKKLNQDLR